MPSFQPSLIRTYSTSTVYAFSCLYVDVSYNSGSSTQLDVNFTSPSLGVQSNIQTASCFSLNVGSNYLHIANNADGIYSINIIRTPLVPLSINIQDVNSVSYMTVPVFDISTFEYIMEVGTLSNQISITATFGGAQVVIASSSYGAVSPMALTSGIASSLFPVASWPSATLLRISSSTNGNYSINITRTSPAIQSISITCPGCNGSTLAAVLSPSFTPTISLDSAQFYTDCACPLSVQAIYLPSSQVNVTNWINETGVMSEMNLEIRVDKLLRLDRALSLGIKLLFSHLPPMEFFLWLSMFHLPCLQHLLLFLVLPC